MSTQPVTDLPPLAEYQLLGEYQPPFFYSESAKIWFIRNHRAELVRAAALVKIAGRTFCHPDRFGRVVMAAGLASMERAK